jgi:4-hydroxybenzoyl-CoA thioesterase
MPEESQRTHELGVDKKPRKATRHTKHMLTNTRKIQIEWGDCDPGGIVYFPRYFEYCDACTNALFAKAGFPKFEMVRNYDIAGIPLVESSARFFIPSQFGDVITIESSIAEFGRASFSVAHKILKGSDLAAEITERRVWAKQISSSDAVGPAAKTDAARQAGAAPIRYKAHPIPDAVKQKFST